MREPLTEEDVKRIASETSRQIVGRLASFALLIAATMVALAVLPALIVMTVNSIEPPLGQEASPLGAVLFGTAFVVAVVALGRAWVAIRRG